MHLPAGRHFALTWSIPDQFGGMTSALLHRSRSFVHLGGVAVDVLTLDDRADYPEIERRLRERGELVDGMRLLNLWEWWRVNDPRPGSIDLGRHVFAPLAPHEGELQLREGVPIRRVRRDEHGVTTQIDHLRDDGSLAVSDRRGDDGARSIVVCDRDGVPVRSFGGAWAFYRHWLDRLTAKQRSFLIVDSKTTANFVLGYRRPHVVTVHVVHSSHLQGSARPIAPLRVSRARVFENLDALDAVVVLSERQRGDIEALLGPADHLTVIPNGRDIAPALAAPLERDPSRGIMLATLTSRKRVDHAVRAVTAASASTRVTLDVYGDGELRSRIERAAALSEGVVRLHGHDPDARRRLEEASFLLLTSRSEGFPLVLVESMAAGCLPIAYDISYGPADIIRHGRNGMLVPSGDVDALCAAILQLQAMPARRVRRMRRAARRSARRFTDRAVTRRWNRELRAAWRRKSRPDM
ncbi:poly(glycerol-phosphate) alpha-glucosyltransferase [Diaminobutyricimonas aerilata]|uniref:Poly(Glycerol-phosphate) alpha-glucosyltransferase n=1 Tax=Diaminobutyricimonas aerilata TaxID=1162967 RepID=A0A2M9CIX3_9MICO|nr:glycosyltransferase [Diaminobutyricimonas aerilata]PJJ71830.1 poly(glycerol-phosphate) alpha-glucosyltransferase [Diaminobutyricimonas aerilata]